jgi:hypothetical protein
MDRSSARTAGQGSAAVPAAAGASGGVRRSSVPGRAGEWQLDLEYLRTRVGDVVSVV